MSERKSRSELDMSLFKRQQAIEEEDLKELKALKHQIDTLVRGRLEGRA